MKSGNLRGKNSLTLTDVNFLDFSSFKEFTVIRSCFYANVLVIVDS